MLLIPWKLRWSSRSFTCLCNHLIKIPFRILKISLANPTFPWSIHEQQKNWRVKSLLLNWTQPLYLCKMANTQVQMAILQNSTKCFGTSWRPYYWTCYESFVTVTFHKLLTKPLSLSFLKKTRIVWFAPLIVKISLLNIDFKLLSKLFALSLQTNLVSFKIDLPSLSLFSTLYNVHSSMKQ